MCIERKQKHFQMVMYVGVYLKMILLIACMVIANNRTDEEKHKLHSFHLIFPCLDRLQNGVIYLKLFFFPHGIPIKYTTYICQPDKENTEHLFPIHIKWLCKIYCPVHFKWDIIFEISDFV